MASFDGVMLGSFVAQVRGIIFDDFGVLVASRGESIVVDRRSNNAYDANELDVRLARWRYLLGHLQGLHWERSVKSVPARLS